MNTTALIRHWNMGGAGRDIAGRFRSVANVREAIAPHTHEDQPTAEPAGLLVKQADADNWMPLAGDASFAVS